jgi:hypothetical protein
MVSESRQVDCPSPKGTQAIAKVLDVGLLRFIDQHITRIRFGRVVAHLRDESGLRDIEVPAALVDFLARLVAESGVHSVTT